jgi:chemotaxis protein methyltransferase CheR
MITTALNDHKLSNETFSRISRFIDIEYGIQLPPSKKVMVESRLQKRLRKLNIKSFSDYADYIFSSEGEKAEMVSMVDLITTNKTDFFREADHFDYLLNNVLPEMPSGRQSGTESTCNVWSCGCSSGEEPYTLAMVLSEFTERSPSFKYRIKGTDISSEVLTKAKKAIYTEKDVEPVPMQLRRKYLLRSRDNANHLVKIKPEIQGKVQFEHLNLMDKQYSITGKMDIIFFRNVAIYFTKSTQEEIITKICRHLKPGGYLFIGHSESLFNMDVPVKQIGSTIYRKL